VLNSRGLSLGGSLSAYDLSDAEFGRRTPQKGSRLTPVQVFDAALMLAFRPQSLSLSIAAVVSQAVVMAVFILTARQTFNPNSFRGHGAFRIARQAPCLNSSRQRTCVSSPRCSSCKRTGQVLSTDARAGRRKPGGCKLSLMRTWRQLVTLKRLEAQSTPIKHVSHSRWAPSAPH